MTKQKTEAQVADLFVIGGGINGCGIARDAAGRGLSVTLAEMGDLASGTSSASTKLFHGGLRYLEYFEFRLVSEALKEREVLLRLMPHISWPMRFVLPFHRDMRFDGETPLSKMLRTFMPWLRGRRPAWLIRLGLFLYDYLGGRDILPGTTCLNLRDDPAGATLSDRFQKAYEYSDCWIEDSRLVVLNARDAKERGAEILTRTKVIAALRSNQFWTITTQNVDTGETQTHKARILLNAAGPWVGDVIQNITHEKSHEKVRLVRGSHIVTRKLFKHDKSYFLQGTDGRIIFAIPYETDFTLIGTTDVDHDGPNSKPICTDPEKTYLCKFATEYFRKSVSLDDLVWSYSGVRSLYDDGATSATAATREYTLTISDDEGAPQLNVFGGKITTYRKLSEAALEKIAQFFPDIRGPWTSCAALAGGDFPVDGFDSLVEDIQRRHPFLTDFWARRLVRAYGTEASQMLQHAECAQDLGQEFGATLTEREVRWLMTHEFALRAEDVVWRRTKLGLRLTEEEIAELDLWMQGAEVNGLA